MADDALGPYEMRFSLEASVSVGTVINLLKTKYDLPNFNKAKYPALDFSKSRNPWVPIKWDHLTWALMAKEPIALLGHNWRDFRLLVPESSDCTPYVDKDGKMPLHFKYKFDGLRKNH